MLERGQCMLKLTVHRSHQLSAESIAKDLQTCGLQISTTTVCSGTCGHMDVKLGALAVSMYGTACTGMHGTPVHLLCPS
ncbi:unnamed protein product [Staurois parvus]|uniref:Uncharacterized protein n=1 Tax=Staurois parvus TaxID=386267 RepID=A0ABN9GBE5_9NEOB|nr:unnamed protein product [Staurois parvus]